MTLQELPHYIEFNGTVVIEGAMPGNCPLCNSPLPDGEISQTDSGVSLEEVFLGCSHCDIWWYSHSEVIG